MSQESGKGRPTVGSLFSGIGGFDLGLERAGFEIRWQVEIDPYCLRVLERHWPDVKRYGDIREVDPHELERVTLLAGGFPCQPVSVAGKRLGQDDPRWLWPEFARFVRALRPSFVLVENVPGLLIRGMGDVLGDLAACGYDAEWQVLPDGAFGAPHLRERVFLVAYPPSCRNRAKQTLERQEVGDREEPVGDGADGTMAHADSAGLLEPWVFGGKAARSLAESCGDSRA